VKDDAAWLAEHITHDLVAARLPGRAADLLV